MIAPNELHTIIQIKFKVTVKFAFSLPLPQLTFESSPTRYS